MENEDPSGDGGAPACVFAKALLMRTATCELARRDCTGEHETLACTSPVAYLGCEALAAQLHERARFALRLPPAGQPLLHMQALRIQCGGLATLQQSLDLRGADVHRTVFAAQERHGGLAALPWEPIVLGLVRWRPRVSRR